MINTRKLLFQPIKSKPDTVSPIEDLYFNRTSVFPSHTLRRPEVEIGNELSKNLDALTGSPAWGGTGDVADVTGPSTAPSQTSSPTATAIGTAIGKGLSHAAEQTATSIGRSFMSQAIPSPLAQIGVTLGKHGVAAATGMDMADPLGMDVSEDIGGMVGLVGVSLIGLTGPLGLALSLVGYTVGRNLGAAAYGAFGSDPSQSPNPSLGFEYGLDSMGFSGGWGFGPTDTSAMSGLSFGPSFDLSLDLAVDTYDFDTKGYDFDTDNGGNATDDATDGMGGFGMGTGATGGVAV